MTPLSARGEFGLHDPATAHIRPLSPDEAIIARSQEHQLRVDAKPLGMCRIEECDNPSRPNSVYCSDECRALAVRRTKDRCVSVRGQEQLDTYNARRRARYAAGVTDGNGKRKGA